MGTHRKPASASRAARIGRVSALAVTLGIGTAVATCAAAHADDTTSGTTHSSGPSAASNSASASRIAAATSKSASVSPSAAAVKTSASAARQATKLPTQTVSTPPTTTVATAQTPTTTPVANLVAGALSALGSLATAAQPNSGVTAAASSAAPRAAATTAPSNVTIEAESLVVSSPRATSLVKDNSASGKKALKFSNNASATTTVTLPEFTSVVIRAKGDQYQGAPAMTVSVDGTVVSTTQVSATSWTDYTIAVAGTAGSHVLSIAFTNDLSSGTRRDRNLQIDKITVIAGAAPVSPTPPGDSEQQTRPYFQDADWLWNPIASTAATAANSATWVSYFTAAGKQHVANLYQYGVTLVNTSAITAGTPRYDVKFTKAWGADPFGTSTVAIPRGTKIPAGSDGQIAVLDPIAGKAFGIWQAKYNSTSDTWSGSWGGSTDLNGNGIDSLGSTTATGISRYAGVVTAAEFSAAVASNTAINHALVFSTDIAASTFVGPAIKSDGTNIAMVATPIPEGYRIQLDPTINIDAIAGISAGEKVIAKTLQTYGAYVVDQGGARMAFAFEVVPGSTATNPGSVYTSAGLSWDYYDMDDIPWASLRVLAP